MVLKARHGGQIIRVTLKELRRHGLVPVEHQNWKVGCQLGCEMT